jgi:hypothetical protein
MNDIFMKIKFEHLEYFIFCNGGNFLIPAKILTDLKIEDSITLKIEVIDNVKYLVGRYVKEGRTVGD